MRCSARLQRAPVAPVSSSLAEKECTCANGDGSTGTACPTHGAEACSDCDSDYFLVEGKCVIPTCSDGSHCALAENSDGAPTSSCEANACTCEHGTGASCAANAVQHCVSCDPGYTRQLAGSDGGACDSHADCDGGMCVSSCNGCNGAPGGRLAATALLAMSSVWVAAAAYHFAPACAAECSKTCVPTAKCVPNQCTCQHGSSFTGAACPSQGGNKCSSCDSGYYLSAASCVVIQCDIDHCVFCPQQSACDVCDDGYYRGGSPLGASCAETTCDAFALPPHALGADADGCTDGIALRVITDTSCALQCAAGYAATGDATVRCAFEGGASTTDFQCTAWCAAYAFTTGVVASASGGCAPGVAMAAGGTCDVQCAPTFVSQGAATITCPANAAPSDAVTGAPTCACPAGHFEDTSTQSNHVCRRCSNGQRPNSAVAACEPCPAGSAGRCGLCQECASDQWPGSAPGNSGARTDCEMCTSQTGCAIDGAACSVGVPTKLVCLTPAPGYRVINGIVSRIPSFCGAPSSTAAYDCSAADASACASPPASTLALSWR